MRKTGQTSGHSDLNRKTQVRITYPNSMELRLRLDINVFVKKEEDGFMSLLDPTDFFYFKVLRPSSNVARLHRK